MATGRHSNEIEITPEMIEAGVSAMLATSSYYDLDEERVAAIWRAMSAKHMEDGSAVPPDAQ
jgi:hypothetical protein